jgi:ribosomal protein L22
MSDVSAKTFDCVLSMRKAREAISGEIAGMTYDEIVQWLRSHRYSDPLLRLMAERAARQQSPAGR